MRLFDFDVHIGDWRVLVQSRDIQNGAVKSRHIADHAVGTRQIGDGEVRSRNIADGAVTGDKIEGDAVIRGKIADDAVSTRNIKNKAVTPKKLSPECETLWLMPLLNEKCRCMQKQIDELRQLVTSYTAHGIALSNCFGANKDIGISQKRITDEIIKLWDKLNEITGEPGRGISVTITPDVFISETTGNVQVTVKAEEDVFEKVKIYVNDELAIEKEYTEGFIGHLTLSETSCIRTVVQILGVEYTDIKIATKLFPFFIGSGTVWGDAMTVEDAQVYRGQLRGSYNMTVKNEDDRIYVIIPTSIADQMIRIDMNGIEIATTIRQDEQYTIYESVNTFQAGRYNIDISDNCDCDCDVCNSTEESEETGD